MLQIRYVLERRGRTVRVYNTNQFSNMQHLASSLSYLLVSCIPQDLDSEESIGLILELFKLSTSMLRASDITNGSLLAACEFVERVIDVHGSVIEDAARHTMGDSSVAVSVKGIPTDVGRLVETLLLDVIETSKGSLGSAWTRDKEQVPRQQSFESRPKAKVDAEVKPSSPEVLAAIFAVLITCAKKCPTMLVCLPATPDGDAEHDRLLSRAVDSCVSVLVESDFDVARSSILFLKSVVRAWLDWSGQCI